MSCCLLDLSCGECDVISLYFMCLCVDANINIVLLLNDAHCIMWLSL